MKEVDYFRKRVAQEDERARRVPGTEAELVHRALAAHYARLAVRALDNLTQSADDAERSDALCPA